MKNFSDQALAKNMLETRDHGFTFGLFISRNTRRYLLVFCAYGVLLIGLGALQIWIAFFSVLGMLAGCLLRDIAWFRAIAKTWPFSVRVIDWGKIQHLADGEPAA